MTPPCYAEPAVVQVLEGPGGGKMRRFLAAPNNEERQAWKAAQWAAGVRRCGYCNVRMTRQSNLPRTCTVDHRQAIARRGLDVPENWIMACNRCNGRKGLMSEASFRALLWSTDGVALAAE